MASPLDLALAELDAALGQLEAAAQRRLELDKRRGDFETELTLMQDDRARLAVDLDSALARLHSVESVALDAGRRLETAMTTIREVIAEAEGAG